MALKREIVIPAETKWNAGISRFFATNHSD